MKACPLRGEECHGVGDILRCAQAAQRRLADQLLHGLLSQYLDHISVDDAGGHAVYPDAGGGQFHSQRPGQGDDARLCAGVSHLAACPRWPQMEEILTMQPRFSEIMWGRAALTVFRAPLRFTARYRSHISSVVS